MSKKSFSFRLPSISLLATLASTFLSHGASAKIPTTAFNGVTRCFKPGKEFLSPTLGEGGLESHLMDTYRFYGNYAPFKDENGPQHAKDISNGDPIWDMVRAFFPSPAGQLNAESRRETNFGHNVDNVKTIALLLNHVNDLREGNHVDDVLLTESIFASLKPRLLDTRAEETKRAALKTALNDITTTKVSELSDKIRVALKDELDPVLKKAINSANKVKGKNLSATQLQDVKQKMVDALDAYLNNKIQLKETKFKKDEEKFKTNFFAETLTPLLRSIQDSITTEKDLLYPKYTTEQVISSFFDYKFNTQQDVIDLLENLDDVIVDKSKVAQIAELKEDDLPDIANRSTYTMDDILALETADIWKLLVPYRDVSAPLSNGNTYKYDRLNDRYLTTEGLLADCGEIVGRHLGNMFFYNPVTKDWDLSHVKSHIQKNDPDNKYFGNCEKFYEAQFPSLANAGDIKMRSLWNRVVGDLNAYNEGANIVYVQGTNELETGHINLIRVFEKIFSLGLKPFPIPSPDKDKELENFEAKKKWLQESYETLFTVMNPTKTYHMDLSELTETEGELSGTLPITVSDKKTKEELFSFSLYSQYKKHSEIQNLRTLKDLGIKDYTEDLKLHQASIQENTAEEVLWMLSPNADLKAQKIHHPLYSLFDQELEDNNSKIRFLTRLNENFDVLNVQLFETQGKLTAFKNMLSNILNDFSWDDWSVLREVSPVIFSLLNKNVFDDVLAKTVKSMAFETLTEESIISGVVQKLESLNSLYLVDQKSSSKDFPSIKDFSFLKGVHPNLKMIDASGSSIESLEGLENLPNLESLYLGAVKTLKKIGLSEPHTGLKILDLSGSVIDDLSGLEVFANLEDLNLSLTKSLTTLSFNKPQLHLKKINIVGSEVETIENLGNCPELEEFVLARTNGLSNVEHISFNGPLTKLTKLDLRVAENLTTLTGLNCPNLEEIKLKSNYLKKLAFENPMPGLKILESQGSALEEIVGLDHCPNLEELRILNARLKAPLVVKEDHAHLKTINLGNLALRLSSFAGLLEHSPNLEELTMDSVGRGPIQDKLSFDTPYNALKKIKVTYSKLGEIEGLDNCPNLESLNLQGAKIKELAFKTKHENLREISVYGGSLESLEGLDNCPNLKELNLRNTGYRNPIIFKEDNKDLVIKGVRKGNIKGIEHLDEKKSEW